MIQKEKKYAKFRFSFILLFIFASFAACFALYMTNDDDEYVQTTKYIEEKENQDCEANNIYTSKSVINPVPKSQPADMTYFNDAVIIANEQMTGFSKFIPSESLYNGGFTPNEIISYIKDKSIKKLYIILDTECVKLDNLTAMSNVLNQLEKEKSDLQIYLVSVLPITAEKETEDISNSDIDNYNSIALKFADENSIYYIDVNSYFVGNDGKMPKIKVENDGTTLTDEAYSEIVDFLLSHIV